MAPRFDLVDIIQTLKRRVRYILVISLTAAVLSAIVYLVRAKKYKATATFFISNPRYADRTNLFRVENSQMLDYFASEDDIDKVVAITGSDSLFRQVIHTQKLGAIYKLDETKPDEMANLITIVRSNFEAKRTENKSMDVSYISGDPQRAADIANAFTATIASMYSSYFTNLRSHVEASLQTKIRETDSAIVKMTDTLAGLRERYGIYDIISPSRKNMISGTMHSTGAGFGRAMEDVQTIESTKDQLVMNRAEYMTLINEFNASRSNDMTLIQLLNRAYRPYRSKDFGLIGTIAISFLVALFFSCLWVLIVAYLRSVTTAERL